MYALRMCTVKVERELQPELATSELVIIFFRFSFCLLRFLSKFFVNSIETMVRSFNKMNINYGQVHRRVYFLRTFMGGSYGVGVDRCGCCPFDVGRASRGGVLNAQWIPVIVC